MRNYFIVLLLLATAYGCRRQSNTADEETDTDPTLGANVSSPTDTNSAKASDEDINIKTDPVTTADTATHGDSESDSDSDSDSDLDASEDSDDDDRAPDSAPHSSSDSGGETDTATGDDTLSAEDDPIDTASDNDTESGSDTESNIKDDAGDTNQDDDQCPYNPNLATHGPWIGCSASTHDDDPYGIQGEWYIEGDDHGSCASTEVDCGASGCRFSGTTVVDDSNTAWGCRMGLPLKVEPSGDEGVWNKRPYDSDANCFDITLEGSSGGADIHIGFTQYENADTYDIAPYIDIGEVIDEFSASICFSMVKCPSWDENHDRCWKSGEAYDLHIEVVGGQNAGNFDLSLTELVPEVDGMEVYPVCATMLESGSSCDQDSAAQVYADYKEYYVLNNALGPNSDDGTQCIDWSGTLFEITSQSATSDGDEPVSFPSVLLGTKGDISTSDSGLPIRISDLESLDTIFQTNASICAGTFNAMYRIELNPDATATEPQLAVELWIHSQGGVVPPGSSTSSVSIENIQWEVRTGRGSDSILTTTYSATNQRDTSDLDLKTFVIDAIGRVDIGGGRNLENDYIINVQAGFRIWDNGQGLKVDCFKADVR